MANRVGYLTTLGDPAMILVTSLMTLLFHPKPTRCHLSLPLDADRENKKKRNEPGMCMKTKRGCGKLGSDPGMSMKTKQLILLIRECS